MPCKQYPAICLAVLAIWLVGLAGCGNPEPEPEPEPGPVPGVTTEISIPDFQIAVFPEHESEGCDESEKPDDVGCTTICKPCKTFVCVDGEWQPTDIKPPEDLCEPRGGSLPPRGCPLGENRFCPAECHICY